MDSYCKFESAVYMPSAVWDEGVQFTYVNDHGMPHAVVVSQGAWEQDRFSWDICRKADSATAALVEAPGTWCTITGTRW